jgi:hypothetical protein
MNWRFILLWTECSTEYNQKSHMWYTYRGEEALDSSQLEEAMCEMRRIGFTSVRTYPWTPLHMAHSHRRYFLEQYKTGCHFHLKVCYHEAQGQAWDIVIDP